MPEAPPPSPARTPPGAPGHAVRHAVDLARRHGAEKLVLVASRRTDMPAFYADELLEGLRAGVLHPQPMMQRVSELRFRPEDIHSVGLWSQDFGPWLARRREVEALPYRFTYRFTILPDDPVAKPKAPRVGAQLAQLDELVALAGAASVRLCVDPLLQHRPLGGGAWTDSVTEASVAPILERAAALGLRTVTLSVLDAYAKVARRAARRGVELRFLDVAAPGDRAELIRLAGAVTRVAGRLGLEALSCCEPALALAGLTRAGACVDGEALAALFGGGVTCRRDGGQRAVQGCRCTVAVDVGRYVDGRGPWSHRCPHDCPQCYARP